MKIEAIEHCSLDHTEEFDGATHRCPEFRKRDAMTYGKSVLALNPHLARDGQEGHDHTVVLYQSACVWIAAMDWWCEGHEAQGVIGIVS